MDLSKLSGLLQMTLLYPRLISDDVFKNLTGQDKSAQAWYLIVRYYEDLEVLKEKYNLQIYPINGSFAYVQVNRNQIEALSQESNVIYLELPPLVEYVLDASFNAICMNERVYTPQGFNVQGEGVLIGVVDSGIDYFHQDFRNEDGTTRIVSLWDQSQGEMVDGKYGVVYTREAINQALKAETKSESLKEVPSTDVLGHGTAVAGIAAGNGKALNGRYKGMAPKSELIVVKAGRQEVTTDGQNRGPNIGEVMMGIQYILEEAVRLRKPVSIVIGYGLNEGLHDGQNALEVYISQSLIGWKANLSVGAGNLANKESHTSGVLKKGERQAKDVFVDSEQPYYFFTVVYGIEDTIGIEVKAPSGESTGRIDIRQTNSSAQIGGNSILINYIGPNSVSNLHQINVLIDKFESDEVATGIWEIILYGEEIVVGQYNIWGTSLNPIQRLTRFLDPDPLQTLTIPGTTQFATTVGAFNGLTNQSAPFSGRGYTLGNLVKPDLVAPGVGVIAPTSLRNNGYATVSGTSVAAAFMAGAYALMMDYGRQKKPDAYLYGEALKAFAIKTALRPIQNQPYPNKTWGYGILCVEKALEALKQQYS
ncbi:MAG: S8 family serine peptidase [Cellulosilyticaceae bacterium]